MNTVEAIEFYHKALTRIRAIELERLRRENKMLRALLAVEERKAPSIAAIIFAGRRWGQKEER